MKKKLITAILQFTVCIFLGFLIVTATLKINNTNFKDFVLGNILLNSDFQNGFENWKFDNGITLTNIDNRLFVHTIGVNKKQTRFYQDINVISGCVYCLKFELRGKQNGAFAIYRDNKTAEEKYLWCGGNEKHKNYSWNIKPKRTGRNRVYLSTSEDGDYFFSAISLCNEDNQSRSKIGVLVTSVITLSILLLTALYFALFYSKCLNFIFAVIILLLMITPIFKISKEKLSLNENRNLVEFKPLLSEGKINTSFGVNFNEWVNDRFFGRFSWITLNRYIQKFLDNRIENKLAFLSDDGWIFSKHNYYDQNYISTCNRIKSNIDKLINYYSQTNINIYFAIIPEKECQYSEKHYIRKFDKEKIPDYLSKICTNNYIYLKDSIENYKQDGRTHFKEDHHWTHLGAFGGYKGIMNLIKKDFDVSVLDKDDFTIKEFNGVYDNQVRVRVFQNNKKFGSNYNQLNLNNNLYKDINKYFVFIPKRMPEQTKVGDNYAIFSGGQNNLKIMVIGDSNIGYILPFITSSFSESLLLYASGLSNKPDNWTIKDYNNTILHFKPQILVVLIRGKNAASWIKLIK